MHPQNVISLGGEAEGRLFDSPEGSVFRRNNLLTGISPAAYPQIEPKIQVLRCAPREVIFEEDEPGDCLYLIAQGSVKISKKGRGGQQETLAFLMEQDFFGEMALFTGEPRTANVIAVEETEVLEIGHPAMKHLFETNPDLAESISWTIAERRASLAAGSQQLAQASIEESAGLLSSIKRFFGLR